MHINQEANPGEGTLGVPIRRVSFQGDNDYWTGGIQPRGTLVQVEHNSMRTPSYIPRLKILLSVPHVKKLTFGNASSNKQLVV